MNPFRSVPIRGCLSLTLLSLPWRRRVVHRRRCPYPWRTTSTRVPTCTVTTYNGSTPHALVASIPCRRSLSRAIRSTRRPAKAIAVILAAYRHQPAAPDYLVCAQAQTHASATSTATPR